MTQVTIEGLSISYGGARVIDGLDLVIQSATFFTLLGPSGCGKTTLLRTLAGFQPVLSGQVRFGSADVTHVPAHKRDIGMVFQDYALFPDKTVFDNVAYGLRARRVDEGTIRQRVGEYLERVGLSDFPARRPAELSGGQRQRVALARALVIKPQLLLMDEPLSNLDTKLRIQLRETIADLQREAGITTVFVTHDQEEALALSDRIGLMRKGQIEQMGPPEEIYRTPVSAYVADFVGGSNVLPALAHGGGDAGEALTVMVGETPVSARCTRRIATGDVALLARPEDIGLLPSPTPNALVGTVRRKQYLGSRTHYGVETASGLTVKVDLHGADHAARAVGEAVFLAFDATRTLVVPR